jgi:superfamily II DNA/RNA helicase
LKQAATAASTLLQALNRQGWKAVAVHGDASQAQRTAAVDSFKVSCMLRRASVQV